MRVRTGWRLLKGAAFEFVEDDVMTLAAALSFYTALSLAPLLVIILWLAGQLGPEAQEQIVRQIELLIGPEAGEAIRLVIHSAGQRIETGTLAGVLGVATLLFSATAVFAQLQDSINRIWNVEARPDQNVLTWVKKRLLGLAMILGTLFLLVVSLTVSAGLQFMLERTGVNAMWQWVNLAGSLLVFVLLFALMFKFLPDVRVRWRDAWAGGALTAVLFVVGKAAIGLYLGQSGVGSAYGAAGSLVVLLVWVYYSSLILFFGAELTQVYARRLEDFLLPEDHARWADARGPVKSDREELAEEAAETRAELHEDEDALAALEAAAEERAEARCAAEALAAPWAPEPAEVTAGEPELTAAEESCHEIPTPAPPVTPEALLTGQGPTPPPPIYPTSHEPRPWRRWLRGRRARAPEPESWGRE